MEMVATDQWLYRSFPTDIQKEFDFYAKERPDWTFKQVMAKMVNQGLVPRGTYSLFKRMTLDEYSYYIKHKEDYEYYLSKHPDWSFSQIMTKISLDESII